MRHANGGDDSYAKMLETVRGSFDAGLTLPLSFRIEQLEKVLQLFKECEGEVLKALHRDLRKSPYEGRMGDIKTTETEVQGMLRHLKEYMADEHLPVNLLTSMDRGYVRKEPYGVVLILGTWNYPLQSCMQPLVGAISAGNCAVIKPSEVTPCCSEVLAKLIPKYLDSSCYHVVTGDVEATQRLLKNKFDYIFCTGSPIVGRSILQAAAPNLTPCTLELGGKSPCYIDKSAKFALAAKRILWGKLINDGQICVSPDYIICPKEAEQEFIKVAKQVLTEWYGEDLQKSPDLIRIVNNRHFNRLQKLLKTTKGKIALGGYTDEEDLWIEPTVVVDVKLDDSLMEEEIFGPILPIVTCNNVDEAIKIIRSKPKPLSLYVFSNDQSVTKKLIESTSSGNVCVNDIFWQATWIGLPFGGVGDSGMGSYHGKSSFDTFCHRRSVLVRPIHYLGEKLGEARYPPFSNGKYAFFSWIIRNFENFTIPHGTFSHLFAAFLGAALTVLIVFLTYYYV